MFKQAIPPIPLESVLRRLRAGERQPFVACRSGSHGWCNLLAFNPIETFALRRGDRIEDLYRFVERHRGRFVAGYVGYDLGYELHGIEKSVPDPFETPLVQFAAYDGYCRFEREATEIHYAEREYPLQVKRILDRSDAPWPAGQAYKLSVRLREAEYQRNFGRIIDYIKAGDTYQINYAHQMQGETDLPGRILFAKLLRSNPVGCAAYWEPPEFGIISLSPESFVSIRNRRIVTCPIKGTQPRGKTPAEDRERKRRLLGSRKEQAELYMITDLLRNDLGKVSKIGSVRVVYRKRLQKLANVFHTYAKVESELADSVSGMKALVSMFPGGSVTGCPKKRAMEIIDEVETGSRGIYTGCIGYILPDRSMEFNIAIRTMVKRGSRLYLGVGGGITIESDMKAEFEETLAKAQSFCR